MPDACTAPGLFTIGHSNVALGDFLALLGQHGIETVADVRTTPRSRWVPHFNAGPLREALNRSRIDYVPFGPELGGRPAGSEFYDQQGHVLYGRLAGSPAFQEGIGRVLAAAQTRRVALLCSEEDPSRCHRHLLIGRVLRSRGVEVSHLRRDGRLETELDLATREAGEDPQASLFDGSTGSGDVTGSGDRGAQAGHWRSPRPIPPRRPPGSGGQVHR